MRFKIGWRDDAIPTGAAAYLTFTDARHNLLMWHVCHARRLYSGSQRLLGAGHPYLVFDEDHKHQAIAPRAANVEIDATYITTHLRTTSSHLAPSTVAGLRASTVERPVVSWCLCGLLLLKFAARNLNPTRAG